MDRYVADISKSRNIKEETLIELINNYQTELSIDAFNNDLIDSIMYEDQMLDYYKSEVDSEYNKINLMKYSS